MKIDTTYNLTREQLEVIIKEWMTTELQLEDEGEMQFFWKEGVFERKDKVCEVSCKTEIYK